MLDLEGIYQNESVEDVLLHFAPRTPYPTIDRMYVTYRFEVAANRVLLTTYQKLIKEGKLAKDDKGHTLKGLNWKEPAFVTEKNMASRKPPEGRPRAAFSVCAKRTS